MIGLCPNCGSQVFEGVTGFYCRSRDCDFAVEKIVMGQTLDSTQVTKLLTDGQTDLLTEFVSKDGKQFSAWLFIEAGKVVFEYPEDGDDKMQATTKSAPKQKRKATDECKPLLDVATKDLFLKNAFRITGLPVDATAREVARHADKLKMLAELGQDPHTQGAAFPMTPPPNLEQIRAAIQKLKDPEKRLIEEFFWFWPEEFGNGQSDPAMQALAKGDSKTAFEIWLSREGSAVSSATAKHNLALVYHVYALDWENHAVKNALDPERREKITNYWKGAFSRWENLAANDHFWEQVVARIRQLNEPNLLTGFARKMRATLPEALDKINAELAVAFAESGKIDLARLHIQFMRETHQGLDNVEKTAELVLTPIKKHLDEQILHIQERINTDLKQSVSVARELLERATRAMNLFDLFLGKENEFRNNLFDNIASVCNRLQLAYWKDTKDDKTCLEILNLILPIVTDSDLRQLVDKDIAETSIRLEGRRLEPLYVQLKLLQDSKESPRFRLSRFKADIEKSVNSAIEKLPAQSNNRKELLDAVAIVLRGISIDAWNDQNDSSTATNAIKLALKYAAGKELIRQLIDDHEKLEKLSMESMRSMRDNIGTPSRVDAPKSFNAKLLLVVVFVLIIGIIYSCNPTNKPARNRSYTAPAGAPAVPSYTPPSTYGGGNSGGNVYRVPSSVSGTLNREKQEIESERTTLRVLESQIEKLGREIDLDQLYLDRTSQYSVDAFNAKVERYNALSEKAKVANAAFNERVDNYNAKLQRYGR